MTVSPYPGSDQCASGICSAKNETLSVTDLKPKTLYSFSVVAVNCAGESNESEVFNIYTRKLKSTFCLFHHGL